MVTVAQKFIVCLVLLLSLSMSFALAEDVTFRLNIPNSADIHVGDTFQIQVLLDITTGKSIKQAEFQLTPSANAQLPSASSGNLFTGATQVYGSSGAVQGTGIKYGETTAADQDPVTSGDQGIEGNNKLFATVTATATAVGPVTFTFSNLVAKKGFVRTTTSSPATITIQDVAPSCTSVAATVCVAGVACPGNIIIPATGCPDGQTCNANNVCESVEAPCTARAATACVAGVACPGNTPIAATGCSQGQQCNAQNICEPIGQASKSQQLGQQIQQAVIERQADIDNSPQGPPVGFLTRLMAIIRSLWQ